MYVLSLFYHSNKTKKNVTTQKAGVMFDMLNTIAQVRLAHTYIHIYIFLQPLILEQITSHMVQNYAFIHIYIYIG